MEFGSFIYAQGTCRAARVDSCVPQRFGGIDVADSGDASLIEKEFFERAARFRE
jgi:hypothetical protein